jgi:hypothetical protein
MTGRPVNGRQPVGRIEKKRSVSRSGAQSAEWSIRLTGRNINMALSAIRDKYLLTLRTGTT